MDALIATTPGKSTYLGAAPRGRAVRPLPRPSGRCGCGRVRHRERDDCDQPLCPSPRRRAGVYGRPRCVDRRQRAAQLQHAAEPGLPPGRRHAGAVDKALGKKLRRLDGQPDVHHLQAQRLVHEHRRDVQRHQADDEPLATSPRQPRIPTGIRPSPRPSARSIRPGSRSTWPTPTSSSAPAPRTATPAGIGVFQGPVQPYVFVVPKASTQPAITAEEAYFVFGFGAAGQATPWIDETFMFIRTADQEHAALDGGGIGVPRGQVEGRPASTSPREVAQRRRHLRRAPRRRSASSAPRSTTRNRDTADRPRFPRLQAEARLLPGLRAATATDKQNVRDGHYVIWSPTVYLAPVDGRASSTRPREVRGRHASWRARSRPCPTSIRWRR